MGWISFEAFWRPEKVQIEGPPPSTLYNSLPLDFYKIWLQFFTKSIKNALKWAQNHI